MSPDQDSSCLKTLNLSVRLGHALVVDDVTITLRAGELAALVGPNGAGKTTLVRALAGLLPSTGHILVAGSGFQSNSMVLVRSSSAGPFEKWSDGQTLVSVDFGKPSIANHMTAGVTYSNTCAATVLSGKVTNLNTGRSVYVTVDDRGPYVGGRIIDLSDGAFQALASLDAGVVPVQIEW